MTKIQSLFDNTDKTLNTAYKMLKNMFKKAYFLYGLAKFIIFLKLLTRNLIV